jgi:NhaP-type Na+/H+ or K+/H+ antiporter
MRRRIALPALLALVVLLAPVTALADDGGAAAADAEVLVLAVEEGDPIGPDPMPRTDEDNPAGQLFPDQETPFTWGAAWLLTFAGVAGVGALVLIWVFLVRRPEREREEAGRS